MKNNARAKIDVKKVLVIGSGPIIIGQAAEFDYSGTQACRSLREEGISVVLLNSNPATIMTDAETADAVYIEPITVEVCERIIAKEMPEAILPTLGGQTGLNLAMELARAGILEKYGVRLLGADADAIADAEDRERFKKTMDKIGEPVAPGLTVSTIHEATAFAESIGYPVIVRPAFTLGGTGGGIANDRAELEERAFGGIAASPIRQILVERSLLGWKEIEYEVMRDRNDACIIVCAMENVDPVGIHTGDSIVVAPTQTLTDRQYQELRTASLRIIRSLRIEGGCNVQYALDPHSDDYYVIEVNPRVSRSSALASKATGYPIAKIAAKIAIGLTLDQIKNPITGTSACFEPALDYCVVKLPRWPFDKFREADDGIGTQMKATGETMAIDRSFERALMKALYSLEIGRKAIELREERIQERLKKPNADRLFYIMWALDKGYGQEYIRRLTGIDAWFLAKMDKVSKAKKKFEGLSEIRIAAEGKCCEERTREIVELVAEAKAIGLSDADIGLEARCPWKTVRSFRKAHGIVPGYRMVDTCAGEFASSTPYYYSAYGTGDEVVKSPKPAVLILGSGPIRIGQGVEFDYCCVRAAYALKRLGFSPIILNNNPETVSTDFDTADALFFEPLSLESVLDVYDRVQPIGVIAQLGGQTALNLVKGLKDAGVPLLGTSPDNLDAAEDREKFDALLTRLGIPKPEGVTALNADEAREMVREIGYPALIRPSYVIGGQSMIIVKNDSDLDKYIDRAVIVSDDNPILIDRYVQGGEAEIDGICDGKELCIVGIMEHAERAGVHSGDSIAYYPSVSLKESQKEKIIEYSRTIAAALEVIGLVNIQYIVKGDEVYVIEVNPRASRTIPILSKATGVDMVEEAVKCMLHDYPLPDPELAKRFHEEPSPFTKYGRVVRHPPYFIVKAPVFSERKLLGADVTLGPQMKSTGEVMGMDRNGRLALAKAFEASGRMMRGNGRIFLALNDKAETELVLGALSDLGYRWAATPGTAECLIGIGDVKIYEKDSSALSAIREDIMAGEISLVVNTAKDGKDPTSFGFRLRELAKLYGVSCLTCADTAVALGAAIRESAKSGRGDCFSLQEYRRMV